VTGVRTEADGELLLLEETGAWVQLRSSRNAACPFGVVIGVSVIEHVSVTGPLGLQNANAYSRSPDTRF
jgi:hypothetical protein